MILTSYSGFSLFTMEDRSLKKRAENLKVRHQEDFKNTV